MKTRHMLALVVLLGMWAVAAQAGSPVASPDRNSKIEQTAAPIMADKAYGDPLDLNARALLGADYLRRMQSDITEDNAGNGFTDLDPQDGGWDWSTTATEHSASASPTNIYGATVGGVYLTYLQNNDPALFTVMQDAADFMVATGPAAGVRSGPDVSFLVNFASLPGVTNPSYYSDGARAIFDYQTGPLKFGSATALAEAVRDSRHNGGYDNGIIPWDVALWSNAAMLLDGAYPGQGYDQAAIDIAEVIYQDSFNGSPGYFDPDGVNQGFDPAWNTSIYWWYPLGVSGIIRAFENAGVHLDKLPQMQALLLDCQYDDGAFSDQYGNDPAYNFRTYQGTAYAVWALHDNLPASEVTNSAVHWGAYWLAYWVDPVTGILPGNTVPEVGGEATAAIMLGVTSPYAQITASPDLNLPDPSSCGNTGDITFFYERNDATPGLFGYELVVSISGGLAPVATTDFSVIEPVDFFRVDDNLDGTFTVNGTHYGANPGLLADAQLFKVTVTTASETPVDVHVVSYRLRDPQNAPIYADMTGTGFVIDCTPPLAVTGITADPRHNKVDVDWIHDGTDTVAFEVYRGLWYDTTPNVSAYPEYDDLAGNTIPTRPVDYADVSTNAEWEFAGSVAPQTTTNFTDIGAVVAGAAAFDANGADRGVYYYEVFAVDAAGNHSAIAPANDRATNYWLGDVAMTGGALVPDGEVDVADIDKLGNAFATSGGDANYRNYIDVGRTDDWSSRGIPLTDNLIDFEDLMVFALNFSVVTPAKTAVPVSAVVNLAWTQRDDGRWALVLVNGVGLQGVHVHADVPAGSVEAGDLVTGQSEMPFLVNVGSKLDVNLALMGRGVSFSGSGELFVVESPVDIKATDLIIDLRAVDNSRLEFSLDKVSGSNTPLVFNLGANYPNPFNPMTKISFSLPAAQDVKLAVYSLDGRRVATLLNETRGPGRHDVVWMGRDDAGHSAASGTYFYRLDAGPYSQVRKMTLMK